MKIRSVAVTALLALSGLISGQAAAFTFDPDGAGPIAPVIMDVFDWSPRNGLIVNGVAFSTTGAQPSYYGQSRLNSLMNQGANIAIPGLGEYTIVMGYGENGLGSVTNVANFSLNPSSSTNFFRIYYDPSNYSSNINGTGFDDGTLVLSGTINDASVTYINGQGQTQQPLDGFLTNNYPGVTTIIGSGTNAVTFNVAFANPAFFPVEQPSVLKYNESNVTPYQQTDPSHQFAGAIQGSVILPAIGAQTGISGPDFQVQVDGNMSVTVVPQAPAIKIVKVTGATSGFANGADANDPNAGDAPQIAIGNTVFWTYRVTTTGNVTLNNVLVTDDQGVAVTCPATTLAAGASMDCTASGAAENLLSPVHTTELGKCGNAPGAPLYKNLGSVVGSPANGQPNATANDLSHYCNPQQPAIKIDKVTGATSGFANGADANDPNAGDAPQIAIGNTVFRTYRVTNTGNVTLNNVLVTDDQGVAVTCPATTLAAGASMDCTASGAAENQLSPAHTTELGKCGNAPGTPLYKNIGSVVGSPANGQPNVTANDLSHYCNPQQPAIKIVKVTGATSGCANGADANDPNAGDAPQIAIGNTVFWTYRVTNTGNVTLNNVLVTDDHGVAVTCPATTLAAGASMDCTASGAAENLLSPVHTTELGKCGNAPGTPLYKNIGSVAGSPANGQPNVTANDLSHYCNPQQPAIKIVNVTGATSGFANGADANDPNAGDAPQIAIGNTVFWTYRVTNTGNVTLNNVLVTDDQGVAVTCPATTLAAGASMDCTASGAAENLLSPVHTTELGKCGNAPGTPLYKNIGSVVGSPANGQPNVTANDLSLYCNPQQPAIKIVKVTGATSGFANGADANDPNAGDAPQIAIGNTVFWTYRVTNTGNVTLNNVLVTDDQGVAVTCPATTLAAGASMDCTASGAAENLLSPVHTTELGKSGYFH